MEWHGPSCGPVHSTARPTFAVPKRLHITPTCTHIGRIGATMRGRIPLQGGDEHDAFTRWRQLLHWQAGELRRIKRGYNKRARKAGKRDLGNE